MGNIATVLQPYQPSLLLLSLWSLLKSCRGKKTFPPEQLPIQPILTSHLDLLGNTGGLQVSGFSSGTSTSLCDAKTCSTLTEILKDTRFEIPEDRQMMPLASSLEERKGWLIVQVFFLSFSLQISSKRYGAKLFKHCRLCSHNLSGTQKHTSFFSVSELMKLARRRESCDIRDGTVNI